MRGTVLAILVISFLSAGCSSAYEIYNRDESIIVKLEKEAVGGYTWQMKPDSLVSVITESRETKQNDSTQLAEYIKVFELKAEKKGKTQLEFIKKRNFEPDSLTPPENHYYKKIRIK